jgi:very-short-patch-repair endonuclease
MRLDESVHARAERHHGCVAIWELRELGAQPNEIMRLRRSSTWLAISRRVLAVAGSPRTDEQVACAAVLEAGRGAALASFSATSLWGLGAAYRLLPASVMTDRAAASIRGDVGRIYPRKGVGDEWITEFNGIPVVRPELCAYQMCGLVHPLAAERIVDNALSMGLATTDSMRRCLDELAKRGRDGTVVYRGFLDERPPGYVPVASGLEARFRDVLGASGRMWRRQVDSGGEMWAGRVDFRHIVQPVVVEVLSRRYHDALSFRRDDKVRRDKLEAAGFTVVEVWDDEVWQRPEHVRTIVNAIVRGAA